MDDDYDDPCCDVCGASMSRETCWQCFGAGGFHDCGEDCCVCRDKEEVTRECEECDGQGSYWVCLGQHNEKQMADWTQRQERGEVQRLRAALEQIHDYAWTNPAVARQIAEAALRGGETP